MLVEHSFDDSIIDGKTCRLGKLNCRVHHVGFNVDQLPRAELGAQYLPSVDVKTFALKPDHLGMLAQPRHD